MSSLIEALKAEHKNILKILEDVYQIGPDTEEGHRRLMAAKNGLLAHLKREDDELYPVLEKAGAEDPFLRDILSEFNEDMATVSVLALAFFAKHFLPTSPKVFALEYEHLANTLMERIEKEETIIYKYYDSLDHNI